MRILLLPGTYDLLNLGDLAMLEVCLDRLRTLWPQARFDVLTHRPTELQAGCPDVHPVLLKGRNRWLKIRSLPRVVFPGIPASRRGLFPLKPGNLWRLGILAWPGQYPMIRRYVSAMFNSDLVVMAGCGVISDVFHYNAGRILDMFDIALRCSIPTVLASQGIGPLRTPALELRAWEVLPRVNRIFIREPMHSPAWLKASGVPTDRITLTGDDAVEIAHRWKPEASGECIGVNLRLAKYSGLETSMVEALRSVLGSFVAQQPAKPAIVGLPILTGTQPDGDAQTLAQLLPEPTELEQARAIRTTAELGRQTARCRVVVTGSYHAGVFALAQGIPAICIAGSDYYQEKFTGLAAQFGTGCAVLRARAPDFTALLGHHLADMWARAEALRPALLTAARDQVQASQQAYEALRSISESK